MDKENGGRNGIGKGKREKRGSRISTGDASNVIVRRKIYAAFIFDPSDALHFPFLSSASRVLLFIREGSLEPPSTLATPPGSECNHLGYRDFTRIQIQPASRFSLPKGLHERLYIDNGILDFFFSLTIVFLRFCVLLSPLS